MSILRKTNRILTKSNTSGARQMSSATEHEAEEQMNLWKRISWGMIAFTGVFTVGTVISHLGEHHDHDDDEEKPAYAYLKMRNKPFPWKLSDCDFFDLECKRKAKMLSKD
uniref:AlNc14C38G3286 protein n=1 Tax=Albugo laibachii Nc14 TaxID=890382 RepID=F0W916_9STRA|nr:AlNc14C38G3286 [Albugo laibachii Nc14]|eukprot:CCA17627.1 AlNc14C38G3286 [Albugo laibachii Nc14]